MLTGWCIKSTDEDKWSHVFTGKIGSAIKNGTCNGSYIVLGSDLICNKVGKWILYKLIENISQKKKKIWEGDCTCAHFYICLCVV